jgi:hypothetical protein
MDIVGMTEIEVEDVFTEDEIKEIYQTVNSVIDKNLAEGKDKYENFFRVESNGFMVYKDDTYGRLISDRLKRVLSEKVGIEVNGVGLHFARYVPHNGLIPGLLPHCDRHSKRPNLTMTVQLESTLDWDFYVRERKVDMKRNKGVLFCSTHVLHWRPDREFGPDDYYDTVLLVINQDVQDDDLIPADHWPKTELEATFITKTFHDIIWKTRSVKQNLTGVVCTNPRCTNYNCSDPHCAIH